MYWISNVSGGHKMGSNSITLRSVIHARDNLESSCAHKTTCFCIHLSQQDLTEVCFIKFTAAWGRAGVSIEGFGERTVNYRLSNLSDWKIGALCCSCEEELFRFCTRISWISRGKLHLDVASFALWTKLLLVGTGEKNILIHAVKVSSQNSACSVIWEQALFCHDKTGLACFWLCFCCQKTL